MSRITATESKWGCSFMSREARALSFQLIDNEDGLGSLESGEHLDRPIYLATFIVRLKQKKSVNIFTQVIELMFAW